MISQSRALLGTALIISSLHFDIPVVLASPAPAGQIVLLQGKASKTASDGKRWVVQKGNAVYEGDTLETSDASQLRIVLRDKSELNLGPSSRLRLDEYVNNEPGVFSLLYGQLRSRVSKSINGNVKLLLKTPSSVMGVRGTDFHTAYNAERQMTLMVTYEGSVAMAKADGQERSAVELLKTFQDQSRFVLVEKGQFSGVAPGVSAPTLPVKISPAQLNSLSAGALTGTTPSAPVTSSIATASKVISVVPPGINPKALADSDQRLNLPPQKAPPPEGRIDLTSGQVAPPAGGYVDFRSGLYIPPPPGSSYDSVAGVYVPPPAVVGGFNADSGAYVAPALSVNQAADVPREAHLLPGLRAEAMGQGIVAAPVEAGAGMAESLSRPAAFRPSGGGYHEGGLFGVLPPPPGSQYQNYDGVQPRYPVYDPSVCPPYCDPRYQPGLYPAMPYRQLFSVVTVIISV